MSKRVLEFSFEGRVTVPLDGSSVLSDVKGNSVDPNSMTDQEIVDKLENGLLFTSFYTAIEEGTYEVSHYDEEVY